jgi:hypothetical protein
MENFWQDIVKLLGILTVIGGAISWIIKSIITHFLSKDAENFKSKLTQDVEAYKSQLSKDTTKEVEALKSHLLITAKEREIRFSKLHEKRAEILSEFYSKLYKADTLVGALALRFKDGNNEDMLKADAQKAHEACMDALNFFEKNKLYLSKKSSDNIHQILSTMELTSTSYSYPEPISSNGLEIYNIQKEKIALIMENTEQEFREILGSESRANDD